MQKAAWFFVIPAVLGVLATWAGHTRRPRAFVIKALFTAALLVLAVVSVPGSPRPLLSIGVASGLLFCMPADALLGLPDNTRVFGLGLAGFLAGYLLYGAALLAAGVSWPAAGLAAAGLAAAGVVQYRGFARLGVDLRVPVTVYVGVVSLLVAAAVGFALGPSAATAAPRALLLAGSVGIYFSDAMIARNLFVAPLRASELVILPPYYAAQLCIVLSLYLE